MKFTVNILKLLKSFSSELMDKHPGSSWITLQNGQHVLIAGGSEGGKARVIFGANAALEHLEIERKTPNTESEGKGEPDKGKKGKAIESLSTEELANFKKFVAENRNAKVDVNKAYLSKIAEITGIDIKSKNKKPTGNTAIDELNKEIETLPDKEKQKIKKALENKALKNIFEETGTTYEEAFGEKPMSTGNEKIDKLLNNINLSSEAALKLFNASKQIEDQLKNLDKNAKTGLKKPEKALAELSNLKDVGINDVFDESQLVNSAIQKIVSEKSIQDRVSNNYNFYQFSDQFKNKESIKKQQAGSTETLNAVLNLSKTGKHISDDLVNLIGVKNASVIVASAMDENNYKQFENYVSKRQQQVIKETLAETNETLENINSLDSKVEEGTLLACAKNLHKARAMREMAQKLALANGSVNASAEIAHSYNSKKDSVTLELDANQFKGFIEKINKSGINASAFDTYKGEKKYVVKVSKENISKLLISDKVKMSKNDFVDKMKKGELIEANYRPAYATIDALPTQQEGIKWALNQKRAVLDFEAGIGKTYTYLGIVGELKAKGDLKDSFVIIAVPSSLRKVFDEDKEKFFPTLKMLNLDEVTKDLSIKKKMQLFPSVSESELKNATTQELKQIAINEAKKGNYDFILTGHDTMKNTQTTDLIASNKPKCIILDEAHQTLSSEGETQRMDSVQKMSAASDMFIAGTGTLVKNNISEFAELTGMIDPINFTDPKKFAQKFNTLINKGSTLFSDNTINEFRKQFDGMVLTRKANLNYENKEGVKVTPKLKVNEVKVNISDSQKSNYKKIETQYSQEKKHIGKFGIVNKETGLLETQGDDIKTFDKAPALGKNGYDKSKYQVSELGGMGAINRRETAHKLNLYAGNWKENNKIKSIVNTLKSEPDGKHVIYYDTQITKEAKKSLIAAMKEGMGFLDNEITMVDGSIKIGTERNNQVTQFQTNPNVKIMLINTAGSTGLNLQSGTHMHMLSRPNSFAEQEQTPKRIFRTGQKKDVQVSFYDSDTMFDQKRVNSINKKKKISDAIGQYENNPTFDKLYKKYIND